jgi:hypothetical protein
MLIISRYKLTQQQQSTMTKNIKVSDELAKRLASHGGFHSTYAQIITMLLDFLRSTTRMTISGHDCTRRRRRRRRRRGQSDRERNIADLIAKAEEEGQDQVQSQDQVLSDFDVLAEKVKNNDHKEIEIEATREGLTTADFIKRRLHLCSQAN